MLEWWNLLALGLAGFITAYVSSVVGFGGGAMMVIAVLFFMPPLVAIPFHAVVQLVANGLRGALLWRSAPWLLIVPFSVALLPGSILGRAAFSDIPEQTIYILIGLAALLAFLPRAGATSAPEAAWDGPSWGSWWALSAFSWGQWASSLPLPSTRPACARNRLWRGSPSWPAWRT